MIVDEWIMNSTTVGMEDNALDGLQVVCNAPYIHDELAVRFIPFNPWVLAAPEAGLIAAGESMMIDLTFNPAPGFLAGNYAGSMWVRSNETNDVEIPMTLELTGGGATVTVEVGGLLAPQSFSPVTLTGHVKTISDGTFTFKGPGMRGVSHHMGRTVVLVRGGIHLVVMERGVSQWDPQLYRSVGLDPADARMVQVKSPMAFRAAYEGLYDAVIVVAAPGAANPDLVSLPWRHLPRPIYPLDPETSWS